MRTHKLLAAAALLAISVATSLAQPYSQNIVGYVNVNLPVGFTMLANQLNNSNNSVATILNALPVGSFVYKFGPGGFEVNECFGGGLFDNPAMTMNPGEGVFVSVPSPVNLTFVGSVVTGSSTNSLPPNFSIRSSIVPQGGGLVSNLGFPDAVGDFVYTFDNVSQSYTTFEAFGSNAWDPFEPNVSVGQAFWVNKVSQSSWVRNFNP